ncbi:MAG TPA: hypothetical protein VH138_12575 [Vicinamibacterales bacterium]|jgi:hypothetical protein|nr:hypothetical protein [Vicinamibacterales bacterium]
MFPLKPLSKDAVPAALVKAERYRLLNEPGEAESICLDVLQVDPDNQDAIVALLLALTDQFPTGEGHSAALASRAEGLLVRLTDPYEHEYYKGIIRERRAKAALQRDSFHSSASAVGWLHEALACFERAEALKPPHNDDATLRWNACARLMQRLPQIAHDTHAEPIESE